MGRSISEPVGITGLKHPAATTCGTLRKCHQFVGPGSFIIQSSLTTINNSHPFMISVQDPTGLLGAVEE